MVKVSTSSPVATSGASSDDECGPRTAEEILKRARELVPWLKSQSDLIEQQRQLPSEVVVRLREAGVFRMNMPGIWGGPEMTPMQQIEVIEELSRGDGSVGWCTMIGCDSGIYSGYLDDRIARQMYPHLDMIQAGWVYPIGEAHRVPGGYQVTGNWMFGSGCTHCDWLAAGCSVFQDGKPCIGHDGAPEWRIVIAKPSDYEIVDTWYSTGLSGSGSHDYRVAKLFVPDERTFSFLDPPRREGPLWRKPDTFLRKMSGIPLGIARSALETAHDILEKKVEMPGGRRYRDMPRVQAAIAESQALYGGARAYVFASLEAQWERLCAKKPLTDKIRADVWLARTNAFQSARQVVRRMYDTLGASAIYSHKSPFDRMLRDTQTICQHICGQTKGWEAVGGMLLNSKTAMVHPML